MRFTGFLPAARELIVTRAQGFCEVCGFDGVDHIHHRRARGMGSTRRPETNLPGNALAISRECHAMVESYRELSLSRGWLVRQTATPAEVPVMIHGSTWVLLNDDGTVTPTTEPENEA